MKMKAIVLVVGAAVCVAAISGCGRKYTATAFLRVSLSHPDFSSPDVRAKVREEYDAEKERQREMLVSKSVLTAALRKPEVAALPSVQAETRRGDAVKWLQGIVTVRFPSKGEGMIVSCTTRDPHEAAVLTNAVVDAYMAEDGDAGQKLQDRFSDVDSRVGKLEAELKGKLKALDRIKAASPAEKAKPSSPPGSADAAVLQTEIKSLKRTLRNLRDELDKTGIEIKQRLRITVMERAHEPAADN